MQPTTTGVKRTRCESAEVSSATSSGSNGVLSTNPLKKRKVNVGSSEYPIYSEESETARCGQQITDLEAKMAYIKSLRGGPSGSHGGDDENIMRGGGRGSLKMSCPEYEQCEKRLLEKSDAKLRAMAQELESTEKYIIAKYECKEQMIHNEFYELIERAKERLIAKYHDRKAKQERLFKVEFARHQRNAQSQPSQPSQPSDVAVPVQSAEKVDEVKNDETVVFERDVYRRASLLSSPEKKEIEAKTSDAVSSGISGLTMADEAKWSSAEMAAKWAAVSGILDKDMEEDVNRMLADRGGGMENEEQRDVKEILRMFPKEDVSYKSEKNALQIGEEKANVVSVGSYIACRRKGQSVMLGQVTALTADDVWAWMRQKGDKFAQYSLNHIRVQHIEDGSVKVKLIN